MQIRDLNNFPEKNYSTLENSSTFPKLENAKGNYCLALEWEITLQGTRLAR